MVHYSLFIFILIIIIFLIISIYILIPSCISAVERILSAFTQGLIFYLKFIVDELEGLTVIPKPIIILDSMLSFIFHLFFQFLIFHALIIIL